MHKKMWMKKDKRGDMGIGVMIIFIAMVLVAAVAASVLISTANQVREQAQMTGDQAINNVASGFVVQDVVATSTSHTAVSTLSVYLRLSAGSPAINMANVVITLVSGSLNYFLEAGTTANTTEYTYTKPVDMAGYGTGIIGQGDLVKVIVGTALAIGYNQYGEIKVMPAYGQVNLVTFQTGEVFPYDFFSLN